MDSILSIQQQPMERWLNGAVAQPKVKLRDGSLIFIGSHVAVFRNRLV